jgi:hypothetical protein
MWEAQRPFFVAALVVLAAVLVMVLLQLPWWLAPLLSITWTVWIAATMVRNMKVRGRPRWLQVLVAVLTFVCFLGWAVWTQDLLNEARRTARQA